MGELLLCGKGIASIPYYIDTVSLNVYSLEELCYYLKHNIDLLEPGFMEEELCHWIRTELKSPELADQLSQMIQKGRSLSQFIGVLANGCNYCTQEEIAIMQHSLAAFENKSEVECKKIRADRLLKKKKYNACILEYQKLLQKGEVKEKGRVFEGNIWHNLGTAYANLFLFAEAAQCYEKAYERNQTPASKQQQEEAAQLAGSGFTPQEAGEEAAQAGTVSWQEADLLLEDWKEEYRKNCR